MKIGVILFLAAGPLTVRAQKPGRPFSSDWLDSVSLGWRPPAVKIAGMAGMKPADSIRILMPDHMPCLVSQYPHPMPMDRRKSRDPMPNGVKRLKK